MRISALGAAVAVSLFAIVGCTKVGTSTAVGTAPPGTVPGVLRFADIQEPSNMNPLLRTESIGTDLDMFVFGFFFNLDDKAHYVPELATEVPSLANGGISKDGLTIIYHLRKGVKWQDGAPFTADDAIFTWKAIMNPDNNVTTRSGWDQITSIDKVNDYEIRVRMKKIYAPAITQFWAYGGLVPVLPAHLLAQYPNLNRVPFNDHPIGTGPFKFVRWVHGDRIEFEANPTYWRGAPKLKRIIFRIIPNDNTILVQLKTHEIDGWFRASSALYPQLKGLTDDFNVQLEPSVAFSHLDLNMKNPLFADLRVRQAIHYAIDDQKIIANITHGTGTPAQGDIPPFSWAYNPNTPWFHYDPAKARALLDQAGWVVGPDGIRVRSGTKLAFDISAAAGNKNAEATEALLQEDFKNVGIALSIKNYPTSLLFDIYQNNGILQKGLYDIALFAWIAGVDPDNDTLYMSQQIPPAGQNNLYWTDPVVDKAELCQLGTFDQAVRKKCFDTIENEVAVQSVTDVLYFNRYIYVTSKALHNFVPAPVTTSNWNTWEWSIY